VSALNTGHDSVTCNKTTGATNHSY